MNSLKGSLDPTGVNRPQFDKPWSRAVFFKLLRKKARPVNIWSLHPKFEYNYLLIICFHALITDKQSLNIKHIKLSIPIRTHIMVGYALTC